MPALDLAIRRRLQRWFAAIGMISAAERSAQTESPETNAMALLSAHAAIEALLGLASPTRPDKRRDDPTFEDLLVVARVRISAALADDLRAVHRSRNGFVHASTVVHAMEVSRATNAAHELLRLIEVRRGLAWKPSKAASVATAVADLIELEAIGTWLRHADEMAEAGRHRLAADGLARALDAALARTSPPLRPDRELSHQIQRRESYVSPARALQAADSALAVAIDSLTSWVLPVAIGLSPAAYDRVRGIVGSEQRVDLGGAPRPIRRPSNDPPTADDLRYAVSAVSEIVFRLWAIEGLRAGRADDQLVEMSAEFRANPTGLAAGEVPPRQAKGA